MKYQKIRKIISFISSFNLVLQTFLPVFIAAPVYAEDATPAAVVEVSPTPEITPEVTPEATPTPEITPEITPDPTPDIEITPDLTPTPEISVTPTPEVTPEITPESTPTPDSTPNEVKDNSPPAVSASTLAPLPEPLLAISELENKAPVITPSLSTDKSDYFPTDTVYVSGTGFQSTSSYILHIYSSDSPIFSIRPEVSSDENGTLAYSFKLDGNYRPHYTIDAYDTENKLVTTYSFTDTDWALCGFQCTAGDVSVTKLELVDATSGNPVTSCTPGDTVNVKIRGTFYNNANSDRVAVVMLGDVYQGANRIQHIKTTVGSNDIDGECVSDSIPKNSTTTKDIHSFSWTCGESVTIQNLNLSWDTGNGTCTDFFAAPACSNRTTKCYASSNFVVSSPLVANFSNTSVCEGTPTSFTNSTSGGVTPYTYSWSFGDASSSTLKDPTHTYPFGGSFTATLTSKDSSAPQKTDSQLRTVDVYSKPIVGFSASSSTCPDMSVTFTDSSTAGSGSISSYLWDFGDGSTSTLANPTHSYSASGDYTVSLTVSNSYSCAKTTQKTVTVSSCASCGDGSINQAFEQCDDGASNTTTCTAPYAGSCSYCEVGTCQSKTIKGDYCGDNTTQSPETCDDGNIVNNDGCSSTCNIEICGDGIVQSNEACDDGNKVNTDSCTNSCALSVCGDGIANPSTEFCDDGNTADNDGCSSTCNIEVCGDGIVQSNETCDDGNATSLDGCSSSCQTEKGSITACKFEDFDRDGTKDAGEGYIDWTFGLNPNNYYSTTDGCITFSDLDLNKDYTVYENTTNGWASFNSTPKPVTLTNTHQSETVEFGNYQINICGDGYIDPPEVCDGDAPIACTTSTGYAGTQSCSTLTCTWDPCKPTEYCGDGIKNGQEVCDGTDGVTEHFTCNSSCTLDYVPYCGDEVVNQDSEQCDDGNANNDDGCSSTCQTEYGHITITKDAVPNDGQDFIFSNDFGNDNPDTFMLDDDSTILLPKSRTFDVLPGTYKVAEGKVAGWKFSGAKCTDGSTLDSIVVSPNESVECIVTNKKLGSVTIVKNTIGGEGTFDFTLTGETLPETASLTTSAGSATQTFTNVDPENDYSITETVPAGWSLTSSTCVNENRTVLDPSDFYVNSDGAVTCTFQNTRDTGSIIVNKYIDADGDINTTSDQTLSANWQFDVDGESKDTTDASASTTDSTGSVTFSGLKTGSYTVIETKQTGYDLIYGNCDIKNDVFDNTDSIDNVTVSKDSTVTCNFYNTPNSTIHGYKWSDLNADSEKGENEGRLSGWTINLYKSNGEGFDSTPIASMDTSDSEGRLGWYWFEKLMPGDYKVCETPKTGWNQTYPQNTDNDNCHVVSLPSGSSADLFEDSASGFLYNFGNIQLGKINVTKYNDLDGDGTQDENERVLGGWSINLTDQESQVTGEDGKVSFEDLTPNQSYTLGETLKGGWIQTNISCSVNNSSNGVKITSEGEAYGHHGYCGGWNGCENAATCAQWACEVQGYDTLISYGDQRPCTEFGNCHLFNQRGSVQYNWGNWCPVMGVTDIVCGNSNGDGSYNNDLLPLYAGNDPENAKNLNVNPGDVITCSIGNRQANPKITISRTNNATSSLAPGDSVEHTIP